MSIPHYSAEILSLSLTFDAAEACSFCLVALASAGALFIFTSSN